MPLAHVMSRGEEMTISYDIYGHGATDSDQISEPNEGNRNVSEKSGSLAAQSAKGVLASMLGARVPCKCLLNKQGAESPTTVRSAATHSIETSSASASLDRADAGKDASQQNVRTALQGSDDLVEPQQSSLADPALCSLSALGQEKALPPRQQRPELGSAELSAPVSVFSDSASGSTSLMRDKSRRGELKEREQSQQGAQDEHSLPGVDCKGSHAASRDGAAMVGLESALGAGCRNVIFIAGLSARGRTEFFQHVVEHLAALQDTSGQPLLSVCTFDNRGIGRTSIPRKKRSYSTRVMAHDTLALLDHLGWETVHVIGLSLGGMIGCKMAAMQPRRIASLTLFGTTPSGWHMLAGISTQPLLATLAGGGPLKWKIPANLRYNFSEAYLQEAVEGGKTRMQVLVANTYKAIEEKDTEKFLAEGQPHIGREGHLAAVFKHRMSRKELETIREGGVPCQVVVGRHDRLAREHFASTLAKQLQCTFIAVESAHAGIMIEALDTVIPLLENAILGNAQSSARHVRQLRLVTDEVVLQNQLYAREFASSFAPGRISVGGLKSENLSSTGILRSKSAV